MTSQTCPDCDCIIEDLQNWTMCPICFPDDAEYGPQPDSRKCPDALRDREMDRIGDEFERGKDE